jgi:hypothetical protein
MTRIPLAIAVLALASPVSAADPPPPASSSSSMSGSSKQKPKQGPTTAPRKLSQAEERALKVSTAKARFLAAVGACAKPEDCDPSSPRRNPELVTMLKSAEDAFVEACVQCATDKACEQERERIRDGRGRFGNNVCAPTAAKPGTPPADKKPAAKPAAAPAPAPSK